MKKTIPNPAYTGSSHLDGYGWMEWMKKPRDGLRLVARPEVGDWPYLIVMTGTQRGKYILAEYCEGDVKVWKFDKIEQSMELFEIYKDDAPAYPSNNKESAISTNGLYRLKGVEYHGKSNSSSGNYVIKFKDQTYEHFMKKADYERRLTELTEFVGGN